MANCLNFKPSIPLQLSNVPGRFRLSELTIISVSNMANCLNFKPSIPLQLSNVPGRLSCKPSCCALLGKKPHQLEALGSQFCATYSPFKHVSHSPLLKPNLIRKAATRSGHDSVAIVAEWLKEPEEQIDHVQQLPNPANQDYSTIDETILKYSGDLPKILEDIDYFKEELEELYGQVVHMIDEGDIDSARVLIEANYEAVREEVDQGIKGVEQAAVLEVLAQLCMSLQDFTGAEKMLNQVCDILNEREDYEPLMDSVMEHVGRLCLALNKPQQASSFYYRSLKMQERLLGMDNPLLSKTLLGLANAYNLLGQRDDCINIYRRVVMILEASKGHKSQELAIPLSHLGQILLEDDKINEAENCLQRVLKIAECTDGGKDGRTGVAVCSLARLKLEKGQFNEAADLFLDGLHRLRNSSELAQNHPIFEDVCSEAAELLDLLDRGAEARVLWQEMLQEKKKFVGEESPELVVHLQKLAVSHAAEKEYSQCEALLRQTLDIVKTNLGPTAPGVSVPMELLATTLHHLGRNKEAEALARQALQLREASFGADAPTVGESCSTLAIILHALGRDEEAVPYMLRAFEIKQNELGSDDPELCWTLEPLIGLLIRTGRTEECVPLIQRFNALASQRPKNGV